MKIVLSTVVAIFLLGCSDGTQSSASQSQKSVTTQTETPSKELLKESVETPKESEQLLEKTAQKIESETQAVTKEIQEEAKEVATTVKEKVVETREDIAIKEEPKSVKVAIDGGAIYKACASCHGANAEKKALNKSEVIQGWEVSKTVAALKGYKDGSYGGPMKGIMKGQVAKLSDAQIQAVAEHISGL